MKFVLLTTTVWSNNSQKLLDRLTNTIAEHGVGVSCLHLILLQNWTSETTPTLPQSEHYTIEFLKSKDIISLSKARNIMLAESSQRDLIQDDDILAFPDDDCWYPNKVLEDVQDLFKQNAAVDFMFCRYREAKQEVFSQAMVQSQPLAKDLVRNASSNTIFLKGNLARKAGTFDETLGVGTPNNGGEDLDYAAKAFIAANKSLFVPMYLIGHRDKDNSLRGKYFRGSAIVLARYKFNSFGFLCEYLRKLMIGLILVFKQEMPLQELTFATKKLLPKF